MEILNLIQGEPEWLEARSKYHTASEAPAMMGVSPHISRNDLLRAKFSGGDKEVSKFVQERVFGKGHEVEASMREAIEAELGEDLFPATVVDDTGRLSASLDGMTMDGGTIWECKQFSQGKVDHIEMTNSVPPADHWQVQQQLLVSGAQRCLYTVGNDPENLARLWVEPDPEAFAAIEAGWDQFDADLAAYEPPADEAQTVGNTLPSLPALRIELTGMVKQSNLAVYKEHALEVFGSINTDLQTDQDFADAENAVKWCKDIEERLAAAKQHALSQTEDIDALFRAVDEISESARQKRLELDKLVKARKLAVRDEIRRAADQALAKHLRGLEERLDKRVRIPRPEADFAAAMKGKRTIASLRDAVDQVLADAKIASSAQADAILANLKAFDELASDYTTLFPDLEQLSYKATDDFTAAVKLRIAEHEQAEAQKREAEAKRLREAAEAAAQQPAAPEPAPAAPQAAQPAPEPKLEPGEATRRWRVRAIFEITAPARYGAEQVTKGLHGRLAGFESLVRVDPAAEIKDETQEAA